MRRLNKTPLLAAIGVLMAGQAAIGRSNFELWKQNYAPKQGDISGVSGDQMLFALAGFREMVAGILWVRADKFFDEGNYDAVLPIIRLVTILDPKQIDVYATGMWHIAYNFTDDGSRSDRRYVPSALALGAEGAKNNDYTYELFFETGWIWYHKVDDDYENAVKWWEQAIARKDMQTARKNILAMAYLRNGQIDKGMDHYASLLVDAEKTYDKEDNFQNKQNRDTLESNLDTLLVRMAQRGYWAHKGGYANEWQYDVNPPYDVGLSVRVTVESEKVIRVEGTYNVQPVGSRLRVVLRDADNKFGRPAGMVWDRSNVVDLEPEPDVTYMQDGLFVKNQSFYRRIDMSRDPTMYPFVGDKYVLEVYYNPRSAPPHLQDRFGFSGEGYTDKNFLNTEIRPGQRVVYAKLELTKDQLLRVGAWATKTPAVQTKNFVPLGQRSNDEVFEIPSMRAGQPTAPAGGNGP